MGKKGFAEEIQHGALLRADVLRMEGMPSLEIENLRDASQDELANEFVTLRMFVGSLFMQIREYQNDYARLHERFSDLQKEQQDLCDFITRDYQEPMGDNDAN